MLTGSELLAKVKELDGASKSELVRTCGYVSIKKDGTERLNFTAFYEALLEAKGVAVGAPSKAGRGRGGRRLSFTTKVQFNGNLLIGSAYTSQLDLRPGDVFSIKVGRRGFTLVPAGTNGDADNEETTQIMATSEQEACTFGAKDVEVPEADTLTADERELAGVI